MNHKIIQNKINKNKTNITKQFQKVFKQISNIKANVSRSKSKDRSTDKSPGKIVNNLKETKISLYSKKNARKCNTPDKPLYKKKNDRSPNHYRDIQYPKTKTPSPILNKVIKPYYHNNNNAKSNNHNNNISLNDQIVSSSYGTNSCSDYSSKTKIVKALNELNTEINQIYSNSKLIKRQGKQLGCLTTTNIKDNNNSLRLQASDLRQSPLLSKNKKYVVEDSDKFNSKETKESNNSNSNCISNNKSIREHYSNYCYSFEDSRCSNTKGIQTIEEVHYVFVTLIQKSKSMIRLQENTHNKEDSAFDTVMKCEERDVQNLNYN